MVTVFIKSDIPNDEMKTEDSGSKNEPPGEKDSEKTKGPDIDGQIVTIQPHDVQRNQRQPAECLSLLIETAKVSVPHSDTSRSSHGSTYCPEKSERAVGYNLLEKTVARRIFSAEDDEYTRFCCLKGTVICIEGIISAGKTTLGNMMKKYLSDVRNSISYLFFIQSNFLYYDKTNRTNFSPFFVGVSSIYD